MFELKNFHAIKIGLASPETILSWSRGEITKPETINYRTGKPEPDGLFCEKVFGPSKDGECHCGRIKKAKYKGVVCPNCGVEATDSKVTRERMGHIALATPVAHIWYYKGTTSRISIVADRSSKDIENLLYFRKCLVIEPGENILVKGEDPNEPAKPLKKYQMIDPQEASRLLDEHEGENFKVLYGAEAVKHLLKEINLEEESEKIKEELKALMSDNEKNKELTNSTKCNKLIKRLDLLESFLKSNSRPEWMILDVVPIIPPGMRPLIELDGGKRASSDLNELYKKVIIINNRLKQTIDKDSPEIMIISQKRELQEAVDALLDNDRKSKPITGNKTNKVLKSLTSYLKGKQGRFRQNLLGKRVDYSGRSVIVVGPELKMYECGLPKEMAKELFKPFIRAELMKKGIANGRQDAKTMVELGRPEVYDALEEVIKDHPVLLNRAPTLHRLGIQAFQPVLVEGNAIKLHPLVCTAFNADFDGDQMAVHVPLSLEAQAEAKYLMLATNNILKLSDGSSVVSPTQDMLLGSYYMTLVRDLDKDPKKRRRFVSKDEAMLAFNLKQIKLQEPIYVRVQQEIDGKMYKDTLETTVGRIIFNSYIPQDLGYVDRSKEENKLKLEINEKAVDKKLLSDIILRCYKSKGAAETAKMLDLIKENGYKYSTLVALTANIYDMEIPEEKKNIVEKANEKTLFLEEQYMQGLVTHEGRKIQTEKVWEEAKEECINAVKKHKDPYNDIWMMADSGARGSIQQIAQIVAMKGLIVSTSGTIELPIKSSFREGLSVLEYFIASHSSRKTLSDTALKTADSGYLTRKLVDVSHDVIIKEHDCQDTKGQEVSKIIETIKTDKATITNVIISLADRIKGRYTIDDIVNPQTNEIIVPANSMISNEAAEEIEKAGIEKVKIRTIFSCKSKDAPCAKCYGRNMAGSNLVDIGDAVGVIAAQSIGEPGTQLTMRTFHSGGVASSEDITQGLPRVNELFDKRTPKVKAILTEYNGTVSYDKYSEDKAVYIITKDGEKYKYDPKNLKVIVSDGEEVVKGDALTIGSKDLDELLKLQLAAGVQDYIMKEVLKIYKTAGVPVNPKHIEIIINQMLKRAQVQDQGESENLLLGEIVDITKAREEQERLIAEGKKVPAIKRIVQGITKSALSSESFLSAASFQETPRILTEAAIKGKVDYLKGLKENVILGKLIPAGTGLDEYQDIDIKYSGYEQSQLLDANDVLAKSVINQTEYLDEEDIEESFDNEDLFDFSVEDNND